MTVTTASVHRRRIVHPDAYRSSLGSGQDQPARGAGRSLGLCRSSRRPPSLATTVRMTSHTETRAGGSDPAVEAPIRARGHCTGSGRGSGIRAGRRLAAPWPSGTVAQQLSTDEETSSPNCGRTIHPRSHQIWPSGPQIRALTARAATIATGRREGSKQGPIATILAAAQPPTACSGCGEEAPGGREEGLAVVASPPLSPKRGGAGRGQEGVISTELFSADDTNAKL